jgi:inosine-uridine nucleoside N-ribohydrolase
VSVPLVLDTDIGGDVDDAYALALALRHPEIDLRAVTTVSGDAELRARVAARLLHIAGRPDVEVAVGIGGDGDRAWAGNDGAGVPPGDHAPLSKRDAVTLLLEDSLASAPATVATIGMQSNVAAAAARDPSYPQRVPMLAVMGGMFVPVPSLGGIELTPALDYNLVTDAEASAVALNAGFNTLYVPCDVTFTTTFTRAQLERLRSGDELCQALAAMTDVWSARLHELSGRAIPDEVVAMMHDPLTVACLVDRSFVTTETLPVYVELRDGVPHTLVDPERGRDAEVVRSVDANAFSEWFLEILTSK